VNFVSFCNVYQDIAAAFPLNNKKIKRVTERETDRQIEVPGSRHKSKSIKSSSSQKMNFVSFCDIYQDIDTAFPLYHEKRERKKERKKERKIERKIERRKYLVVATSPSA
jgi:hypothetical protein